MIVGYGDQEIQLPDNLTEEEFSALVIGVGYEVANGLTLAQALSGSSVLISITLEERLNCYPERVNQMMSIRENGFLYLLKNGLKDLE